MLRQIGLVIASAFLSLVFADSAVADLMTFDVDLSGSANGSLVAVTGTVSYDASTQLVTQADLSFLLNNSVSATFVGPPSEQVGVGTLYSVSPPGPSLYFQVNGPFQTAYLDFLVYSGNTLEDELAFAYDTNPVSAFTYLEVGGHGGYLVDTSYGAALLIGTAAVSPTPEPGSMAMVVIALAVSGGYTRLRKWFRIESRHR